MNKGDGIVGKKLYTNWMGGGKSCPTGEPGFIDRDKVTMLRPAANHAHSFGFFKILKRYLRANKRRGAGIPPLPVGSCQVFCEVNITAAS